LGNKKQASVRLDWFLCLPRIPIFGITAGNPLSSLKFDTFWYQLPANSMLAGFLGGSGANISISIKPLIGSL